MNIKFILLTICLTLKVTNIKGQIIEIITIGFDIIDVALQLTGLIQDDSNNEVVGMLDNLMNDVEKMYEGLSEQMHDIDNRIIESTMTILSEFKIDNINKVIATVSTSTDHIGQIVDSYNSNKTFMINYLEEFIKTYQIQNYETNLIAYLDESTLGSKSLVISFIDHFRQIQLDNKSQISKSVNKLVHEFYSLMMLTVGKGQKLLELCYKLKSYYSGESYNSDEIYLDKRKNDIMKKLSFSWEKAMDSTDMFDDYVSNSNLNYDVDYVRFKTVLQTHLVSEKDIKDTCSGSCDEIKRKFFDDLDCTGTLHNCYDLSTLFTTGVNNKVYSIDSTRIWERYSFEESWFGRRKGKYDGSTKSMDAGFKFPYACNHCRCTCDQKANKKTVRSIYVGKIEPEQEGFVITGVRFAESDKTIYLQIEVGQLLPIGFINSSTVYWQYPPKDIVSNVISFNFDFLTLHLDVIKIDTGFLSGIQFYNQSQEKLRLRAFSKSFKNYIQGTFSDDDESHTDESTKHPMVYFRDTVPEMLRNSDKIQTKWNVSVVFGVSNQEADAGQSTIPYFDSTDINFDIRAPLGGLGLCHFTNNKFYAGYIRPFIFSLNYKRITKR